MVQAMQGSMRHVFIKSAISCSNSLNRNCAIKSLTVYFAAAKSLPRMSKCSLDGSSGEMSEPLPVVAIGWVDGIIPPAITTRLIRLLFIKGLFPAESRGSTANNFLPQLSYRILDNSEGLTAMVARDNEIDIITIVLATAHSLIPERW